MKIDYDELARILDTFLNADSAFITLKDVGIDTTDDEDKLIFHLLLLVENGLLGNRELQTGTPECIGLKFTTTGIGWRNIPIRLTQDGHDFANALHQKPILERIKKEFAEAPFDVVKDLGKGFLTQLFKKKLGIE
ncbi:DUF2513 domain-containing protein [Escherichia coli]|uniref:DUF2513 domain-containing protein n=1 Tax=Escherichia coli TaxID=562 RepID=UPI0007A5D19E|nr:DUF2513 domain-containing protein [Escherichia coli]